MHLVFLHGFLGTKADWDPIIKQLPFKCTAIDLPGHGDSPIDFDLYATLSKLEPFHLIGYSLGGRIALQYPGQVLSLTLLSAHPGLKTHQERAERLQRDKQTAQEILKLPTEEFLKRWYSQPLFKTLSEKMDICKLRQKQNREGLAHTLVKYSLGNQPQSDKHFQALIGQHDSAYRTIYQNIPHTLIPDAGHAIHLENPDAIAKELVRNHSVNPVYTKSNLSRS